MTHRRSIPYRYLLPLLLVPIAVALIVPSALVADPCAGGFARRNPLGGCSARAPGDAPSQALQEVFVIGDSLTVGAEPWLEASMLERGWRLVDVDARVGRPVYEGLSILEARREELPLTVLVALGTNDLSATETEVIGWLREARGIVGARRLVWVDLCLDDSRSPRLSAFMEINETLRSAGAVYGVQIAGWCASARASGIDTIADGIHYGPAGYRTRAEFYAESLEVDEIRRIPSLQQRRSVE